MARQPISYSGGDDLGEIPQCCLMWGNLAGSDSAAVVSYPDLQRFPSEPSIT
ncbi:MAG UNVERIFIED_CONTAM: hypothetical protein LVR29_29960 [Microcystis novacekii LVE1205-3]